MSHLTTVELHPRNVAFQWQQPEPPFEIITQEHAQAYRDVGGFVLPDAFFVEELRPLIEELDKIESTVNLALLDQPADQPSIARHDEIVFSAHVVLKSELAVRFSKHPQLVALCRDLLGNRPRLYWDQLVYKRPGTEQEFPWHQDNGYTYVDPQQYLTCWIALNDATVENGCPWIAPGLHARGTLKHEWAGIGFKCLDDVPDAQPMPLSAGSIAVFSSLTPHRTGPNLTDGIRKAYILQYAADGAVVYPHVGDATPADDPHRQYLVT